MSDIIDILMNSPGGVALTTALVTQIANLFERYRGGKKSDEKGSTSNAEASITKAEFESLIERAEFRAKREEIEHQKNIEKIIYDSLASIKASSKPDEVDRDWLAFFFDKSRRISNEDAQRLWSQILAGEINQPGSISLRTLNFLTTLTKLEAQAFRHLCSYVWLDSSADFVHEINADYVPKIIITDDMHKSQKFGINITKGSDIYYFDGIGLLTYGGEEAILQNLAGGPIELMYHNQKFRITGPLSGKGKSANKTKLPTGRVKFTQVGRELYLMCAPEPNREYMNAMIELWKSKGFDVVELPMNSTKS